jgi:thioesterase domain-containing protein
MELRLALILEELLQLHPIGVRDDFFTLGGNSLLAIHLVARLAREFGVELTLGTLVEASRIETLARLLVDRDGIPAANGAVKLQAGGHLRPFFFVHPIGGNVLCYVELARLLGEEQPVYGLEPSASGEGPGQPNGIPGMAADYVRTVRRLQPQGPYFLGGLSFGGFVAYEMAQQLRREGEEVAVLALLDTWAPHRDDDDEAAQELVDGKIIWGLASDFAHTYGKELSLAVEELVGLPLEEQMDRVLEDMRVTGLLPNSGELSQMRRSLDWYRSNTRALRAYVPAPYAGTITLLRAGELDLRQHYIRNHPLRHDPTRGWSVLSSQPVQAHEVPGTHTTMIMDPLHLRTLAARLRGILERAHAAVEGCSPGAAVARTD